MFLKVFVFMFSSLEFSIILLLFNFSICSYKNINTEFKHCTLGTETYFDG